MSDSSDDERPAREEEVYKNYKTHFFIIRKSVLSIECLLAQDSPPAKQVASSVSVVVKPPKPPVPLKVS